MRRSLIGRVQLSFMAGVVHGIAWLSFRVDTVSPIRSFAHLLLLELGFSDGIGHVRFVLDLLQRRLPPSPRGYRSLRTSRLFLHLSESNRILWLNVTGACTDNPTCAHSFCM